MPRTATRSAGSPERTGVASAPGATRTIGYDVAGNDHWYDLTVAIAGTTWARRFAGHVDVICRCTLLGHKLVTLQFPAEPLPTVIPPNDVQSILVQLDALDQ